MAASSSAARCNDIRIARRQTQGVTIFQVAEDEQVVAVAHMPDVIEDGEEEADADGEETVG